MKRVLAMLLICLMLTGCSKTEPTPTMPEVETPPAVEKVETPAVESAPASEMKPVSEPAPIPEPEPEPAPEPETDWAAFAAEAYADIVNQEEFRVLVWQENDSCTDLLIRRGENDWNVETSKYAIANCEWSLAASEDWIAMVQRSEYDPQLSFYVPGGASFTCCQDGDIVEITDQTKITYLRAVNPKVGQDSYEENLYGMLHMVAEDAVSYEIGYVTVDGSLSPQEAAQAIAEKRAENHRNAPDWVEWKVTDALAGSTEVFDIYWGEPQEFCCNLKIKVYFDEDAAANNVRWQTGAGLSEPDEEGYREAFSQLHVRKNEDGDWVVLDGGTGGYTVSPEWPAEKPWLDWLVEVFCLTEGFTHDWLAPYRILELSDEEIAALPAILDQLTEAEARDLCETLGRNLREYDYWDYTVDTLAPLMGNYGSWLDA